MFHAWLAEELEELARSCPNTGEDVLKQLYQWEHDLSKAWALALLGSAFAFVGTAALSLVRSEVDALSWATWILVLTGGLAIILGALALRRLHGLIAEYLLALHAYTYYRDSIYGGGSV